MLEEKKAALIPMVDSMSGFMHHSARVSSRIALALTAIALFGCGSGSSNSGASGTGVHPTQAAASDMIIVDDRPGASRRSSVC